MSDLVNLVSHWKSEAVHGMGLRPGPTTLRSPHLPCRGFLLVFLYLLASNVSENSEADLIFFFPFVGEITIFTQLILGPDDSLLIFVFHFTL